MNVLSPTMPYTSSPGKGPSTYVHPPSANQTRRSPTRMPNYSSPPQSYQSPPCEPLPFLILCSLCAWYLRQHSVTNIGIATGSRPPRLPPLQATDLSLDQYYPPSAGSQLASAFGQDARSPRPTSMSGAGQQPGRGPVPKFQKIKSVQELQPRINVQPPYRRANPEGGFISVSFSRGRRSCCNFP